MGVFESGSLEGLGYEVVARVTSYRDFRVPQSPLSPGSIIDWSDITVGIARLVYVLVDSAGSTTQNPIDSRTSRTIVVS